MSSEKMTKKIFEGAAVTKFRVTDVQMAYLLFAFCILGHSDDRWVGDIYVRGYEGFGYWEEVAKGQTLTILDKVAECIYQLDAEKLMQGIRRWIENGEGCLKNGQLATVTDETIADRIIQYALFGEVRYE